MSNQKYFHFKSSFAIVIYPALLFLLLTVFYELIIQGIILGLLLVLFGITYILRYMQKYLRGIIIEGDNIIFVHYIRLFNNRITIETIDSINIHQSVPYGISYLMVKEKQSDKKTHYVGFVHEDLSNNDCFLDFLNKEEINTKNSERKLTGFV